MTFAAGCRAAPSSDDAAPGPDLAPEAEGADLAPRDSCPPTAWARSILNQAPPRVSSGTPLSTPSIAADPNAGVAIPARGPVCPDGGPMCNTVGPPDWWTCCNTGDGVVCPQGTQWSNCAVVFDLCCPPGLECIETQPPTCQPPTCGGGDSQGCPNGTCRTTGNLCCPPAAEGCGPSCCSGSCLNAATGSCSCPKGTSYCGGVCCDFCVKGRCLSCPGANQACGDSSSPFCCATDCQFGTCTCPTDHPVSCGVQCCLPGASCSNGTDCGCPAGTHACNGAGNCCVDPTDGGCACPPWLRACAGGCCSI